jgi:hypothetical protein
MAKVTMKLNGEVEVDGTYLSGRKTVKKSYGRARGKQRYKEKTLIIAQKRKSRKCTILLTNKHENAKAADELAQTIEEKTPIFTDGGHSKISAWVHLETVLDTTRQTCNHSRHFVNPTTGVHINTVENRNKLLKKWLKNNRGGGSRNYNVLMNNLSEYLFKQWFSTGLIKHDLLSFLFALYNEYGF